MFSIVWEHSELISQLPWCPDLQIYMNPTHSAREFVEDPNQSFCYIQLHSTQLLSPLNIALLSLFSSSLLPLKQHITAGGPLFSVLLSWKLLLILTFQCFLYVLPNIFESTARPFEPLWKMLAMPLRLLGSWFEILQWHTNGGKNEEKKRSNAPEKNKIKIKINLNVDEWPCLQLKGRDLNVHNRHGPLIMAVQYSTIAQYWWPDYCPINLRRTSTNVFVLFFFQISSRKHLCLCMLINIKSKY